MQTPNNPIIQINSLVKTFKGTLHALAGVDLTIQKGEVVSIIGPSGSGKSTLLRCMNLMEVPTSGVVIFEGEELSIKSKRINQLREKMGMVFQSFNLFPHLSVKDNITLSPKLIKHLSDEDANLLAQKLLQQVGF